MKATNHENVLAKQISKQLQTLPQESLLKVAEYIEFLRFQTQKPVEKAEPGKLTDSERRRILKRVRYIEKRTKKYIPYDEFVREYEKKWGVKLDEIESEE